MKLLSIIYADDGRKLKQICQWLIKSWACDRIIVSNYIHSYVAGKGKWLVKTQHKLIQIQFEESNKLIAMLDKLVPEWKSDYRINNIDTF